MDPIRVLAATASRRRRVAILALAMAGALGLLVLTLVLPRLGGNEDMDIRDIVARVEAAAADPASVGLESYVGEAEYSFSIRPGLGGDSTVLEDQGTMKIWFESPELVRWEYRSVRPEGEGDLKIWVADGEEAWTYSSNSHSYGRWPLPDLLARDILHQLDIPGLFAIEDVLGAVQEYMPDSSVVLRDDEVVAGRDTYVIEAEQPDRQIRLWLDKEYLLLLRSEQDSGPEGGWFRGRFTSIRFDQDIDDALFQFAPPQGAIRDTARLASSGLEPGMLKPTWIPADYRQAGSHGSSSGTQFGTTRVEEERRMVSDDGTGSITLLEVISSEGLPGSLKRGAQIEIRGQDAWLEHRTDGFTVLVWEEGALTVTITANQLSDGDLLRIAASMERLPEDDTDEISLAPAE